MCIFLLVYFHYIIIITVISIRRLLSLKPPPNYHLHALLFHDKVPKCCGLLWDRHPGSGHHWRCHGSGRPEWRQLRLLLILVEHYYPIINIHIITAVIIYCIVIIIIITINSMSDNTSWQRGVIYKMAISIQVYPSSHHHCFFSVS